MARKKHEGADTEPLGAETVLDEAARRFLEQGYHRTRMRDIAESFGVTHAALYYHFRNKQDILAQINVRAIEQLLAGVEEEADAPGSSADRFFALLGRHMRYVAENPAFVATFLEHDLEIPEPEFEAILKKRREYTDILVNAYREGARDGELPAINATVAVSLLLGSCNWIYRWYSPQGGLSVDELIEQGMLLLRQVQTSGGGDPTEPDYRPL